MDDNDRHKKRKEKKKTDHWAVFIIPFTFLLSGTLSFFSETSLSNTGVIGAFIIWCALIFIGILFDAVGIAVTAANETPFIAMASKKVPGAQQAVWLIKHADKVACICNDVVGDICAIIGGAAGVAIAARLAVSGESIGAVLVSALTAAFTVGGKYFGKKVAISKRRDMVYLCGYVMAGFSRFKKGKKTPHNFSLKRKE